jgi:hypothetical protein
MPRTFLPASECDCPDGDHMDDDRRWWDCPTDHADFGPAPDPAENFYGGR